MTNLNHLLKENRAWAARQLNADPDFFVNLEKQQRPEFLWIGCADSRVPANQIVDLAPGELFVHRNVANLVLDTDTNCLAVIQYAVEVLRVKHIIVCGHYGCGGVAASLGHFEYGLVDNWLRQLKDLYLKHQVELDSLTESDKVNRLCELNVISQVTHVARTKAVQYAWKRGWPLSIHGWIYGLHDGHLHDLDVTMDRLDQVDPIYQLTETQRGQRPGSNPI